MNTSNFLASTDNDKRLDQITVPGSHSAGVYVGSAKTAGPSKNKWTICQHGRLMQQLRAGFRFFDIRVSERGGAIEAVRKKRLRAGLQPPTLPNIVMYDFVNSASSVPTIALNWLHLRVATR